MIEEYDEIADFAAEAMAKPAHEYELPAAPAAAPAEAPKATLVRCVACRGTGVEPTLRALQLWGGNCWCCSGWGRNLPHMPFRGPFQPNPIRSLMQSFTSQEDR